MILVESGVIIHTLCSYSLWSFLPPRFRLGCLRLQGPEDASQLHLASYGSGAVSDPSRVSLGGEGIWRKVTSQWYSSVATAQLWAPPPQRKLCWVSSEPCVGDLLQCPLDGHRSRLNCHYDDPLSPETPGDPPLFHPGSPFRVGFWVNIIKDKSHSVLQNQSSLPGRCLLFPPIVDIALHRISSFCYQQERIQFFPPVSESLVSLWHSPNSGWYFCYILQRTP